MENTCRDTLEEIIAERLEALKMETAGTEEYDKKVKDIVALYGLKLSEDRLDEEASAKASQRGIESEKLEFEKEKLEFEKERLDAEKRAKTEDTKQTWLKVGADIGKILLTFASNGILLLSIMNFDSRGNLPTKYLNFLFKPKL